MANPEHRDVERLFHEAASLPPVDRAAYLDAHCHDSGIRNEVEKLLRYDELPGRGLTSLPKIPEKTTSVPGPSHAAEPSDDSFAESHGQFLPGTILADRYRIVSLLGKGGMGEVYRADDLILKEPIALKILPRDLTGQKELLEALRNEVKQARQVSHRHVCRVHDIGDIDGRTFLSMEFIEGENLASLLHRIGRLPVDKSNQLAVQLAAGLEAAHSEQVLHLDLKPANLMIDRNGNLKIADFGLARINSTTEDSGLIAGTPGYMAPEQALGEPLTTGADIFAFGLILYEITTGHRAINERGLWEVRSFFSESQPITPPREHVRDVSPDLENLILACLNRSVDQRPASMAAIHERLLQMASPQRGASQPAGDIDLDSSIEDSDVYLCFAHVDDQPPSENRSGWITQFQRNLQIRVEQLSGKQTRVFRAPRAKSDLEPDTQLLSELPTVKAMVSVVSPPFVNSTGCVSEVNTFWDTNQRDGRLYVDGHTRVLKVVKTPVDDETIPAELGDKLHNLLGFDFFEYDSQTGRLREYAEWFGSDAEQRFHERVYDVAQEINALFKAMNTTSSVNVQGKTVYLATTSSDIAPLRDRIRRELIGRGHRVLPEQSLPLLASEAKSAIKACLAESDLSIHPFGSNYGVIPEGSSKSLAALQNELAAEHSKQTDLRRVIWIPSDVASTDPRQTKLFEALKTDPEHHRNAEIIINTFQMLKPIVLERLAPIEKALLAGPTLDSSTPRRIYLICDPQDEDAIEPLEDYFYEQGFDLILPDFEADEAQAAQSHRDNLQDCDGVIIFYGAARSAWVDVKLRSVLKVSGYGREANLVFNAVYVAPPFDRRKERYRTHSAEIIRQSAEFEPSLLKPLTERLHQS